MDLGSLLPGYFGYSIGRNDILIDQADVIQKALQHLGLWEESHAPPEMQPLGKQIKDLTFDPSYTQLI